MRDKEEITQSVEVVIGSSGTATLQWIDCVKKGRAQYKFAGKSKQIEYEIVYSSELTIAK